MTEAVNVFDEAQLGKTVRIIDERDDAKVNVFNEGELEKTIHVQDVTEIKVVSAIQRGLPGADGNSVLSGEGVPGAILGVPGDQYIDLLTGRLYEKVGITTWDPTILVVDARYEHVQDVALAVWTVTHNLGKYPSITVIDSGGSVIEGDIEHIDANMAQVTFVSVTSGKVYCN